VLITGVIPVTSIRLTQANGQELLDLDRRSPDPEVRLRADSGFTRSVLAWYLTGPVLWEWRKWRSGA
jgi:hypothetical protein